MAKDQRNVEAITPMEEDFAKWYTGICLKAELVDYASVKGFMILRPYGYAIWENIQRIMDGMFKKTGHVNVAMPVLIPESLLKKEGELVQGFAPEVAWVTHGGSEKLEERLAFRPTSETMFCDHWHNVLQSYRELPMLYNQWCSVIRWEKTTRPFLRSREFWWQEGHTIHETAEEAIAETEQQLNCYADFCRDALAMPVVKGRKTEKEKFAGAEATYTIEAMMKDQPLFRRQVLPRLRCDLYRPGQQIAVSLPDQLGIHHTPDRRVHHDPLRQQRPGAAACRGPHSGGGGAYRPAQGRRAGCRRCPERPPDGHGSAGEDGRQRAVPRLEVCPV